MCYCQVLPDKTAVISFTLHIQYVCTRTGTKIFFSFQKPKYLLLSYICLTFNVSYYDHFILNLITCFYCLLFLLSSYCVVYLSSIDQQLHSSVFFCLISPNFFLSSLLSSFSSSLLSFPSSSISSSLSGPPWQILLLFLSCLIFACLLSLLLLLFLL